MATASRPSYVSGDLCHCDHVLSILGDFSHDDRIPSFPYILGDFGHGDYVPSILGDFGHCDHVPSVLGDFGHDNRIPSFVCFRWFRSLWLYLICFRRFRSWWTHPVLSYSLVIPIIMTASHSFPYVLSDFSHGYRVSSVLGDFGHYDRVLFFSSVWWFLSWWSCPVHSFSLVILVMTTASRLF